MPVDEPRVKGILSRDLLTGKAGMLAMKTKEMWKASWKI